MKRWRVIVELSALRDIEEAQLWLAERDPDAAERWFNSIYDTIGSLEIFPERCPFAPEDKSIKLGIREIFHGHRHINTVFFSRLERTRSISCMFATAHGWLWAKRNLLNNHL